jgi:RNA polymerase sigma factor (sigma-70 family)
MRTAPKANREQPRYSEIAKGKDGDSRDWELLRDSCYYFLLRLTGNNDTAQDLASETVLKIFNGLKTFRGDEVAFQSWYLRVAKNLFIDFYRTRLRQNTEPFSSYGLIPNTQVENYEGSIDRKSGIDGLASVKDRDYGDREVLEALLEDERLHSLILVSAGEFPFEEASKILGLERGTTGSRYTRGRDIAKNIIKKRFPQVFAEYSGASS